MQRPVVYCTIACGILYCNRDPAPPPALTWDSGTFCRRKSLCLISSSPTCLGTASPSQREVATEEPGWQMRKVPTSDSMGSTFLDVKTEWCVNSTQYVARRSKRFASELGHGLGFSEDNFYRRLDSLITVSRQIYSQIDQLID